MDEFDTVYRAVKAYRDLTDSVPEIQNFLDEMHTESNVEESLECFSTICHVDDDWVNAIKKAMPFVSDAVMENRQFVRSDGEVVPIEKVRTVGKDTVTDLAKHSNYITRDPESTGGRIVPDKLMMPLKDNDYAIYENRFLYTLLVYLSQFIEIRLNEILAVTGKYEAKTRIVKKHASKTRNLSFEMVLDDTIFNDPYASKKHGSFEAIDIIKECLNQTKMLLMTPLMKMVSKAPMVKDPVVKTNVFRFDHNFKESLSLYQFLHAYSKKGYTIENISTKLSPFQLRISESFSTIVYLSTYFTYIYGNSLEANLKSSYEKEEKRRKEEAEKKLLNDIRRIGRDIKDSGMSAEEYVLQLLKATQILERHVSDKEAEVKECKSALQEKVKQLTKDFNAELDSEKEKMKAEIDKKADELALQSLTRVKSYSEENERLSKTVSSLTIEKEKILEDSKKEKTDLQVSHLQEVSRLNGEYASKEDGMSKEIEDLKKQIEALNNEKVLMQGKIDNLRNMNGLPSEKDMTEKDNFDALEKEKLAFDLYFDEVWKETKKRIRKETMKIDKKAIKAEIEAKKKGKALKKKKKQEEHVKDKEEKPKKEEKQESVKPVIVPKKKKETKKSEKKKDVNPDEEKKDVAEEEIYEDQ